MNNEVILPFRKQTDALIQRAKNRPRETVELKSSKQTETFSVFPPD